MDRLDFSKDLNTFHICTKIKIVIYLLLMMNHKKNFIAQNQFFL